MTVDFLREPQRWYANSTGKPAASSPLHRPTAHADVWADRQYRDLCCLALPAIAEAAGEVACGEVACGEAECG
jgi:hypothetical protein